MSPQSCEIDRRPRLPRQLAGENGNSTPCEANVDAGELTCESPFNPDIDPFNSCVADEDAIAADATAADFAFKPNCLDIHSPPLMRTLLTPDAVPEFNLKQIDDSSLCFGWFTHKEQRKVARSIPVAISAARRMRCRMNRKRLNAPSSPFPWNDLHRRDLQRCKISAA